MTACAWGDCNAEVRVRGFCRPHYNKAWREGLIESRRFKQHKGEPCAEEGCPNPAQSVEWCAYHYQRRRRLRTKYGISPEDYDLILEVQGGVCTICREPNTTDLPLYVDHDHDSGWVRGLLCNQCNQGLGFFGDNPKNLMRAIGYLASVPPLPVGP